MTAQVDSPSLASPPAAGRVAPHPHLSFLGRRLTFALMTLFAISLITFLATNVLPGNPAHAAMGIFYSPQRAQAYLRTEGYDKPVLARYFYWLGHTLTGNWGDSLTSGASVSSLVVPRALRTLTIGLCGVALALPLAFLTGMRAADRSGGGFDSVFSGVYLLFASVPEFVIAAFLLLIVAVKLQLLPVSSAGVAGGSWSDAVQGSVLPVITLMLISVPYFFRLFRASARDAMAAPYARAAELRGISPSRLRWRHVFPNAVLPMLGATFLATADIIGGLIIIEQVFNFPGIGQLLVDSTTSGDYPTVQAVVFVFALGYIVLNLVGDLLTLLLNPRLRER